jgi:hypothetical protein
MPGMILNGVVGPEDLAHIVAVRLRETLGLGENDRLTAPTKTAH